jgi:hypothetical protein
VSGFGRAVLVAVLLAIAITVVAWATGPQRGSVPPTAIPVEAGSVPSSLVNPVSPDYQPICDVFECAVR